MTLVNDLHKYLHHLCRDRADRWHPFLSVYYLTYACDFRCPYCSDGSGRPYHELPNSAPTAEEAAKILTAIRRQTDHLVITGGEPLNHPEFGAIIRRAGDLGFKDLALTTNGHRVDTCLPELAASVTSLVFSLDTLDETKADAWHGAGGGTFARIMANLEKAAAHPGRRFDIVISSVVTPVNIEDLYEVHSLARERDFLFAAAPHLDGVKAVAGLAENADYRRFFDYLIREKLRGRRIFGTRAYLEHMRDLRKFRCRPFTMLVVAPGGEVFYPCLEIGHHPGSILGSDNLHALRLAGKRDFGPQPSCDTRCHSACALGFSLLFSHPASVMEEIWLTLRGKLRTAL
jgi:MoaA/NifB/PqqE/SkfB family radical SAM enzyme